MKQPKSIKTGAGGTGRRGALVSPELVDRSAHYYRIAADGSSIRCLVCGEISRDPRHINAKYCPRCLVFHDDRELMTRLSEGYQRVFQPTDKRGALRIAA